MTGRRLALLLCAVAVGASADDAPAPDPAGAASGGAGRALAGAWCGRCHAAPAPDDLDRATWTRHVLPEMGARLGIYEFRGRRWRPDPTRPTGTYPAKPLLPLADWARIFDYYRDGAPAKRRPAAAPPARTTGRFDVLLPPPRTDGEPAAVTGLLIDERAGRILVGDGAGRRVLVYDRNLRLVAEAPVDTPPVHFAPLGAGAWLVTLIGSLAPGGAARGAVVRLDAPESAGGAGRWRVTRLVRRLPRPVRTLAVDADRDGLRDLVVAGFGDARGGIFLHRASAAGGFHPIPLLEEPGAVSIALHGGDLYALMAQGDERLLRIPGAEVARLARSGARPPLPASPPSRRLPVPVPGPRRPGTEDGGMASLPVPGTLPSGPSGPPRREQGGGRTPSSAPGPVQVPVPVSGPSPAAVEIIRRFPPQRGSSAMRVLDFDGDGTADLLVTAGDNADFTPVFKPGHGVRLYLGDGDGRFRLALFHRLDGAYGAVAEDFDGDGDRDVAAVAWFADYSRGPEGAAGFVYLENLGSERFRAARVPGLERLGRFAVIDAGDLDGDGDPDVVLGNLAYGAPGPAPVPPAAARAWAAGPRFVLLRTRGRPRERTMQRSRRRAAAGHPPLRSRRRAAAGTAPGPGTGRGR